MTDSVPTSSTASTSTHHGLSTHDSQASTATTAQQGKSERGRNRSRGRGRGRGGGEVHAAGSDHEHNSNDSGRGGPSASVKDRGELAGGMHDPQASGSIPTGPSRGGRGPGRGANGRGRGRGGRGGANNSRGGPSTDASEAEASSNEQQAAGSTVAKVAPRNSRRQQFGGKLSTQGGNEKSLSSNGAASAAPVSMPAPIDYSDLRSRLIAELTTGSYDCSICYSGISYKAPVWSCSQCHTVLHLSCVKQWASSSVKAAEEQNAMQEDARIRERKGTWRCPGCQFAREEDRNRILSPARKG
jgi:transcriptional repressor NF-X1